MATETEARVEADPWEEILAAWASARASREGDRPFTMDEVLTGAFNMKSASRNARVTGRVSRLLGRLGYERRRRSALPRTYHYVRAHTPSPAPVPTSHRPTSLPQSFSSPERRFA